MFVGPGSNHRVEVHEGCGVGKNCLLLRSRGSSRCGLGAVEPNLAETDIGDASLLGPFGTAVLYVVVDSF